MEELLIKRPCILVQDLQRSLKLYQDSLGFAPTYTSQASPDSYLYKLFEIPSTAALTFVSLDTPTEKRALAITEVKHIDPSFFKSKSRIALVTQVKSVPEIIAKIKSLELSILPQNQFQTEAGQTFIEQGIQDFDGNRIVLYSCGLTEK